MAALLLLMSAYCVRNFEFTTEITHFLPFGVDQGLLNLSRAIADSELARTMILSIEALDPESATAASGALAEKLRPHPQVAWVRTSPDAGPARQEAVYDLYFPRRLLFLSENPEEDIPERLTDEGLVHAARQVRRELATPIAPLVSRIAGADPLLAFLEQLARLRELQGDALRIRDGRFTSVDGLHGLVFLATRSSAFRSEDQEPLLQEIQRAFLEVNAEHGGKLRLEQSGFNRFAVASERSIRRDIARISLLSTAGGILLFLLVFRSPGYIALLMVPLGAGMVSGLFACLVLLGKVHGVTLAFAGSLIGVCIDYPIHLFNHHTLDPDPSGPAGTLRRIWSGVLLGALTTIAGLVGMAWTPFQGIREIVIFAPAGILGALITTRYVLPPLMPRAPRPGTLQRRLSAALAGAALVARKRRGLLVAIAAAALLLGAAGLPLTRWQDDLLALNSFSPELLQEDQRVRELVAPMESGRFVVAIAKDEETALRRNDAVYLQLEKARADGLLESFRSLHSLVWSRDLQNRNLAVLRSDSLLAERARAAFTREGFRPGALDPFARALSADPPAPLNLEDLRRSPLADAIGSFCLSIPPSAEVGILSLLRNVRDSAALARRLEGLDGVTYFDQIEQLRHVYRQFRVRTLEVIGFGLIAVFALVYARYRQFRLALAAFLPAVLSAGAALGLLALLGVELNLMNLIGTLLVLSMGVDYGIFMVETREGGDAGAASLLSLVIACLTTVLSFGLMGLSDNPALRGIGLTTGLGSLFSLVLTPTLVTLLAHRGEAS